MRSALLVLIAVGCSSIDGVVTKPATRINCACETPDGELREASICHEDIPSHFCDNPSSFAAACTALCSFYDFASVDVRLDVEQCAPCEVAL